jgi:hypothetical protein
MTQALKEYEVFIGGIAHTVQLNDEDAKRHGFTDAHVKRAPAPANKARTPESIKDK